MTRQKAAEEDIDEPARRYIAEPPNGLCYPTQELSKVKDKSKKTGFLGSMSGRGVAMIMTPLRRRPRLQLKLKNQKWLQV